MAEVGEGTVGGGAGIGGGAGGGAVVEGLLPVQCVYERKY